jgi:hypothetical protein
MQKSKEEKGKREKFLAQTTNEIAGSHSRGSGLRVKTEALYR